MGRARVGGVGQDGAEHDGRGPGMTLNDTADGLSGLNALMRSEGGDAPRGGGRGRRIAGIITAIVLIVAVAVPVGYVVWALNAPLASPTMRVEAPTVTVPAAATIAAPADGASAISISGADAYLGPEASGLWAPGTTGNMDEPRPIASISKIITALVILDAKPLDNAADEGPTITFSKADHDLYDEYYVLGATIANMPTGSSLSLRGALEAMLIPSASNYAEAVSTWAFGSQGNFVAAARRWLDANGLGSTTIVEPTGISSRNTSTPNDLMKIGRIAAANPVIAQISAMTSMSRGDVGMMQNTNSLLGRGGVTGLKTGNLGAGRHNLLYTASLDIGSGEPLSVTGVRLGGASRDSVDSDVLGLLDSIRAGFHWVPLAEAGQQIGSLQTPWDAAASVVIAERASIFTWSDTPIVVTMETNEPTRYEDGEVIGSITWTAGPNTKTVPVRLEGTIRPPTEWWRLTNPGKLGDAE